MRTKNKILSLILALIIILNIVPINIHAENNLENTIKDLSTHLMENIKEPGEVLGSTDWIILGLARSNNIDNNYIEKFYKNTEKNIKDVKGILHDKKYSEYSRLILTLTSIGKDPTDVGGYNLLLPLGDFDKTIWQGINGPIWALLAANSNNYEIPENNKAETQASKEQYLSYILENQNSDGGWSLYDDNSKSDIDLTAMALQALAKYKDRKDVSIAIEQALEYLSENQTENAGFMFYGEETSESCVQVIVALSELGISLSDERFVKNNKTPLDNLMTYYVPKKGFKHLKQDTDINMIATQQGLYGLVAANRLINKDNSLYDMTDVKINKEEINKDKTDKEETLIKVPEIKEKDKTFIDLEGYSKEKIEKLAQRHIINGKEKDKFYPNDNMTRAEFAKIITSALGLKSTENIKPYKDVNEHDWYFESVNIASEYKIVSGIGDRKFNPNGKITKQEAAVMIMRASKLIGLETKLNDEGILNILSQFEDYREIDTWAKEALAFCYTNNIIDNSEMKVLAKENVNRDQIAQMVYNMLSAKDLI